MLELVRSGRVRRRGRLAVPARVGRGRRQRYKPAPERVVGTSLLRLLMRLRLGQPISDGTSGLYAVDRYALALLADDYLCEAPEVEALMRITDAKLRLVEVPVHMRQREHGESSFHGKRAVELVVTIGLTLFAAKLLRQRHRAPPAARDHARAAAEPGRSRSCGERDACRPAARAARADAPAATATAPGVGAARSPASCSRCDPRAANAAQPCAGPAAADTSAPAPAAASRLWRPRARSRGRSCPVGRTERAATAWSTSITSAAVTAVANTRRFVRAASGATTSGRDRRVLQRVAVHAHAPGQVASRQLRAEGLEPPSRFRHRHLKPARLPISPRPRTAILGASRSGGPSSRGRRPRPRRR